MSRRRKVYKKEERVDSRYGSPAVARLITTVMKRGKKSLAERIVYSAIEKSREGSDSVDPLEVVNKAIENVRPRLEVKSRRVGGATYQVPMEVTPARQISLATRWIVQYADNRKGMPMADALAHEIKDAAAGQGNAIKKREDTHKMAQANRAGAVLHRYDPQDGRGARRHHRYGLDGSGAGARNYNHVGRDDVHLGATQRRRRLQNFRRRQATYQHH